MGYGDRRSVAPGDTIRFMVSCLDGGNYDTRIVRLKQPEAGFNGRINRVPMAARALADAEVATLAAGTKLPGEEEGPGCRIATNVLTWFTDPKPFSLPA